MAANLDPRDTARAYLYESARIKRLTTRLAEPLKPQHDVHRPDPHAQPERQNRDACLPRYEPVRRSKSVPILLWLLGVPLSLVVILWLVHVI